MMTERVVSEQDHGHVRLLRIERPKAANAVNRQVTIQLGEALERADEDPAVRAIVVTGAGSKAFCAGADLKAIVAGESLVVNSGPAAQWGFAGFVRHHVSTPTIAAVVGSAYGGGTEIVLACDLAVMAQTATLSLPEVKRGLVAAAGGMLRLPRQIPEKVALELLLTGRAMSAAEAERFGLINRLVPADQVVETALALAAEIAANAPLAVQATKRVARGIVEGKIVTEVEAWRLSREEWARNTKSDDAREGPRAFAERRQPVWKAR